MSRYDQWPRLTRRGALGHALGLGISLQFLGGAAFASDSSGLANRRLVVIICRGGLDGLSLSPPVGDARYADLRGTIAIAPFGAVGGALKLDETFGLHPAMPALHALALKGQARIAPAIATPDRERSHFEAQDVLESGAVVAYGTNSGWLNRALLAAGPPGSIKALSLGPTAPLLLRGSFEAASWSPGLTGHDSRLAGILQDLYARDPMLGQALAGGLATQAMAGAATAQAAAELGMAPTISPQPALPAGGPHPQQSGQARQLGATLAGFMAEPDGPRVAGLEMDGFDTHAGQGAAEGQLAAKLTYLDAFLDSLEAGLSGRAHAASAGVNPPRDLWSGTVVVVATEFGRTARINGTAGTDHGTASTALLLGGAIKPGGIIGDWPTLAEDRLFEHRDTAPTLDMRGLFKGVLRDHLGIERARLDALVFPDSAVVAPVGGLVA